MADTDEQLLSILIEEIVKKLKDEPQVDSKQMVAHLKAFLSVDSQLASATSRMIQNSHNNAKGFQTLVEGGIAIVGDRYYFGDKHHLEGILEAVLEDLITEQKPKSTKIPHNIPRSSAKKFVGREEELQKLYQLLQENDVVAITDKTGQGGVGKTEIAKKYAWTNLENYVGGCCWLNAQGQGIDVTKQVVEFGRINLPNFNPPPGLSIEGQIGYSWNNWQQGKVLLVFDNVKHWREVEHYIPPQGLNFKVLITTRQKKEFLPCPSLELGGLKSDEALELYTNLLGKEHLEAAELSFAKQICQKVNYIPIGLYLIQDIISQYKTQEVAC